MRCASCVPRAGWIAAFAVGFGLAGVQLAVANPRGEDDRAPTEPAAQVPSHPTAARQPSGARSITRPSSRDSAAAGAAGGGRVRTGGSWLGSLLSLAAVVAMIVLGAKLWKKHGPPARAALPSEAADVLGRRVIDPRQSIYLVRLGSRILVLGSTAAGLSTLAEITDPVEVDFLAGLCRPPVDDRVSDERRGFAALFDRQLWGGAGSLPKSDTASSERKSPEEPHPGHERLRRSGEAHA